MAREPRWTEDRAALAALWAAVGVVPLLAVGVAFSGSERLLWTVVAWALAIAAALCLAGACVLAAGCAFSDDREIARGARLALAIVFLDVVLVVGGAIWAAIGILETT